MGAKMIRQRARQLALFAGAVGMFAIGPFFMGQSGTAFAGPSPSPTPTLRTWPDPEPPPDDGHLKSPPVFAPSAPRKPVPSCFAARNDMLAAKVIELRAKHGADVAGFDAEYASAKKDLVSDAAVVAAGCIVDP